MTFNSSKCFVMHMSHKKNPWLTTYIMQDVPLQSSITQKYLGVELTSNLDWNIHINTITTKANKTLGLLHRHFRCCSPATKETAYKALVRPQMEYCSAVWDPYEKGDTETLEKVQRRAARFVKGDYHQQSSVTQMIKDLGWQSLQERRAISRLSLMYKSVHGLSEVQLPNLMRKTPRPGVLVTKASETCEATKTVTVPLFFPEPFPNGKIYLTKSEMLPR